MTTPEVDDGDACSFCGAAPVMLEVVVPAHLSATGEDRQAVKPVDACIAAEVAAYNADGRLTAGACCGHGRGPGSIIFHDGTEAPAGAVTAAVDPYRIPGGHVGGGRFAKRGDVGEVIVRAAKSIFHTMSAAERDAERTDLTEALDHATRGRAAAAARVAQQIERTTAHFGDRRSWPASSEHTVRALEAEVARLDKVLADGRDVLDELDAVDAPSTALHVNDRAVNIDPDLPDDVAADIATDAQPFIDRYADFLGELRSIELHDHNTGFANKDRHRVLLNRGLWSSTDWDARHAEWEPYTIDDSPGGTVVHELGHIVDGAVLAAVAATGDPDLRRRYEDFAPSPNDLQNVAPSVYGMENRYEFIAELLSFEHYGDVSGALTRRDDIRAAATAKLDEWHKLLDDVRAANAPARPPAITPEPDGHLVTPEVGVGNDLPDPPAPKSAKAAEKALRKLSDEMTGWLGIDPVGDIQVAHDVPTARTIHSEREGSIVVVNPSMIAHPEDGGVTLRFITHEAAHTLSPERTLPGFAHDIEEGGAELLSQMFWSDRYALTDNDAFRADGRWVGGPAALWGHGGYHDLTRDLLGRVLAENPDATQADVKARLLELMRSDHYERMDFHGATDGAAPATGAQLAWLLGGNADDFDKVIAARSAAGNDLPALTDPPPAAPAPVAQGASPLRYYGARGPVQRVAVVDPTVSHEGTTRSYRNAGDVTNADNPLDYYAPTVTVGYGRNGRPLKTPKTLDNPFAAAPGTVAFIDYENRPDGSVYIHYANTHGDHRGNGYANALVDQIVTDNPGATIDFGKVMTPAMWRSKQRLDEAGVQTDGRIDFNPSALNDLPAIADAPPTVAPDAAIAEMVGLHHETFGYNGVSLPTLPTVANGERYRGQALHPATQAAALDALFRPSPGGPQPPPILDNDGTSPIRTVAVELDSGQVAAWVSPNPPMPPQGRWATLPADHPDAPALVTAGWLASPSIEHYLGTYVQPRLRAGLPVEDRYPGLLEAATATSDALLDDFRGADIRVRRVNTPDLGVHYEPDPDSTLTIDGDAIHFADFDTDGSLRLWAHGDATDQADLLDPLSGIDYTDADDPDLPWERRVAALADARRALLDHLGPDPAALFDTPTEDDMPDLIAGIGGDREYTLLRAFDRFGESLDAIIEARRADIARGPDKEAILGKLSEMPDFPEPLAEFLATQPWDSATVGALLPATDHAPGGGGMLRVSFPDDPDTYLVIGTTVGSNPTASVGWEFSAAYQMAHPTTFATLPPRGIASMPADRIPSEWYTDVVDTGNISRTGEVPPALRAMLDTYEALGIDMGTDGSILVAEGRNIPAEDAGYPYTGANPIRLDQAEGEMAATLEVGLRPFPKSWVSSLGARLTRVHTDPNRPGATGTSRNYGSTGIVDVPSVIQHPDLADAASHEFTHLLERTVPGLMNIETWHFIQRLRAEAARRTDLATWTWQDGSHGYRDDFGMEYMGRVYRDPYTGIEGITGAGGHEIFSTVAQGLWGHNWRARVNLDPAGRRLLLALMGLLDPPPPAPWKPPL